MLQFRRVVKKEGSVVVVSSLTPWPWPSKFSKEVHTDVKIPPSYDQTTYGGAERFTNTFPIPNVFLVYSYNHISRVKVEIAPDLPVLRSVSLRRVRYPFTNLKSTVQQNYWTPQGPTRYDDLLSLHNDFTNRSFR